MFIKVRIALRSVGTISYSIKFNQIHLDLIMLIVCFSRSNNSVSPHRPLWLPSWLWCAPCHRWFRPCTWAARQLDDAVEKPFQVSVFQVSYVFVLNCQNMRNDEKGPNLKAEKRQKQCKKHNDDIHKVWQWTSKHYRISYLHNWLNEHLTSHIWQPVVITLSFVVRDLKTNCWMRWIVAMVAKCKDRKAIGQSKA